MNFTDQIRQFATSKAKTALKLAVPVAITISVGIGTVSTIGAQPADEPAPPAPIVETIPDDQMIRTNELIDDDHNQSGKAIPDDEDMVTYEEMLADSNRSLEIQTRVFVQDDELEVRVHFDEFKVSSMTYTPFLQGIWFGAPYAWYGASIVGVVLHEHTDTGASNSPDDYHYDDRTVASKVIQAARAFEHDSAETCVKYSFSASVEGQSDFLFESMEERPVVIHCPRIDVVFGPTEGATFVANSLWSYETHLDLLNWTTSVAAEYIHGVAWDSVASTNKYEVTGILDTENSVSIEVDIFVQLVERDPSVTSTN